MKLNLRTFLILFAAISFLATACKKEEEENNSNNTDQNGGDDVELVFGCMVDTACNFNPLANQENESCDYSCYGCTDETAFNYNPDASIDDGSCVYAGQIMIDTWNVDADCFFGAISEVTLEEGDNEGDLVIDFGIFTLNATVNNQGLINIPSQDVSFAEFSLVTISGSGELLQNEQTAIVTITASALLVLNETCTLTLTL
ncbi:hypothetical protein N9V65_00890 [Flavobacteriales bacterium]|nr:hypothetical protein [Flavobacteriales bacterium]